jgi:hypothetical protein
MQKRAGKALGSSKINERTMSQMATLKFFELPLGSIVK